MEQTTTPDKNIRRDNGHISHSHEAIATPSPLTMLIIRQFARVYTPHATLSHINVPLIAN